MPKLKLTKTNIDKLKPDPTQDTLYWDTGTRGLGLRVTKAGVFSFIAQGRVRGTTKDVRLTIGTYGAWSLEDAQRKADYYRQLFEDGVDPREVKKAQRAAAITLGEVCVSYLNRPKKLKPTTAAWINYYVDRVFFDWKDKPVTFITKDMVTERHAKLVEGGLKGLHPDADHGKDKRKPKGAPSTANSSVTVLRILLKYAGRQFKRADGTPLFVEDPTDGMSDNWAEEGDKTERYIPYDRVGATWNALNDARDQAASNDQRAGIDLTLFLLLTGCRRNEGAALTWDRVFIDEEKPEKSYWRIVERKVGKPISLPLTKQAAALLNSRKRVEGNPYVFSSERSKCGHILDPRSPLELVSDIAGLRLSSHDLRRSFTGIAFFQCFIEKFRVDLLIGHKVRDDVTASNYLDKNNLQWLWQDAQKVSDWIEGQARIAAAKANGANVVQLPAKA
ncbi:MAG: hypothetical protein A3D16_21025 [Rhodobacterales bacterium RIFCSPHIGHO2_02_FULL_62_130]|nr:MAG: hypothetical protein A3D16_21025 [Rhodobacterales bacterium RIFCSPHIGHO2_02_FULL_62_130]OHC59840.1 MAG: hypothetical protein A3E48_00595 [Rhodobacterales bacterium RIFCSPHIGHO2_12_FULL_62_75]HCZ00311.1 preprotein translocase [Rhodobacter sp.]